MEMRQWFAGKVIESTDRTVVVEKSDGDVVTLYTAPVSELVAAAQARWARECEIQSRARAAEQARNPWSRNDYPGTD